MQSTSSPHEEAVKTSRSLTNSETNDYLKLSSSRTLRIPVCVLPHYRSPKHEPQDQESGITDARRSLLPSPARNFVVTETAFIAEKILLLQSRLRKNKCFKTSKRKDFVTPICYNITSASFSYEILICF